MSADTQYITLTADDIMRVGDTVFLDGVFWFTVWGLDGHPVHELWDGDPTAETDYRVERCVTDKQEPTP